MREGFAGRHAFLRELLTTYGLQVEALCWAYGESEVLLIVDAPDAAIAIGTALSINVSGVAELSTTPLLTAEEMDEALLGMPSYRIPG